ncbi:uncharacterized protein PpBr36_10042 [Pyricularia pennisetigena]|uniref:uncharacterized protein n=1 Tax=Pyricularia pennisetigena TaxID=1578925 RepID=UPI001153E01E|nr:uncharacterized protein PpBr36_10042 [Pyricularia pennisetigena]TLS22474.1 hypothetical protein PpBr36_10042 [Pyricularia pennisetigena]
MNTVESGANSKASSTTSAPTTPPGIPAPYGRACANCVKAKCKCFYRGSGREISSCERCHRLGKDCVPSESVRRRTSRRQGTSRTAQLEEKLDDLVSLLKTHQQKPGVGPAATSGLTSQGPPTSNKDLSRAGLALIDPSSTIVITNHQQSSTLSPLYNKAKKPTIDAPHGRLGAPKYVAPTSSMQPDQEAEECFQVFSKHFLHSFPFYCVTEDMTASQLQPEYPVFMLAIKSICSKVFSLQLKYSEQFQHMLAQKILIECENSMDLLLALITCIGWIHFHEVRRPHLTVLTRLAMSQVIELGLHRPFGETSGINSFKNAEAAASQNKEPARPKPNNEQRRAALGCYLVTSSMFTSMKRAEGLPWTPYLEEMMADLIRESDWKGDNVLVAQVKFQQLHEQLYRARYQPAPGDWALVKDPHDGLPSYYINLLRQTSRDLWSSLPEEVAGNASVRFFQRYLELVIAESSIDHKEAPFPNPKQVNTTTSARQLENIHALVEALERFFDVVHEASPMRLYGMPYTCAGAIPLSMWMLLQLCISRGDSVWNPSEVRRRMDLLHIIDGLREKLVSIPDLAGLSSVATPDTASPDDPENHNIFSRCGPILDNVRMCWAAELQKHTVPPPGLQRPHESTPPTVFNGSTIPVTQQGPIATQMSMPTGFESYSQPQDPMPMVMPQYDFSSWLSFPPLEQGWYPMDVSYN